VNWRLTTDNYQVIFEIVNIDKFCGAAACAAASAIWSSRCVMKIRSLSAPGQYLIFTTEVILRTVSCFRKFRQAPVTRVWEFQLNAEKQSLLSKLPPSSHTIGHVVCFSAAGRDFLKVSSQARYSARVPTAHKTMIEFNEVAIEVRMTE
jgi:hypothetical protein